ncbi:50S ribosomal protein L19 [Candidatus Berkelbacteria bacterium]|nr:50S ribosomal protein L19 [Candidatus Berkelbacteria bacterium]
MHAKLLALVSARSQKKNTPTLRAGDVVRVHQKVREGNKERIQVFEGLVLRVRGGRGMDGTFTVRRISGGIGIERTFPLHLPSITKVEKIKHIKFRQARPYYVRNLTTRQITRSAKGELAEFVAWEEKEAEAEEEKIKAQHETEAKARVEAEKQAEAEAEAKVSAAKAKHK